MKIYRAIDEFEYNTYLKKKRFLKRVPYLSKEFSSFNYTENNYYSSFFFLSLKDAIDFGINNLLDFYVIEMNISKHKISKYLGVGLYEACEIKMKFETLIPIKELNKRLKTIKFSAHITNGYKKYNYAEYDNQLCFELLDYYKIKMQKHKNLLNEIYYSFAGNKYLQNSNFNLQLLNKFCRNN